MKNNMTKKQRLEAYKAAKAAAREVEVTRKELIALLERCQVYVTSSYRDCYHDCIIEPQTYLEHEVLRGLLGESTLRHAGGGFTFPVEDFFFFAERYNPHLLGILPEKVNSLYAEGRITFTLERVVDYPSLGCNTAIFKVNAV